MNYEQEIEMDLQLANGRPRVSGTVLDYLTKPAKGYFTRDVAKCKAAFLVECRQAGKHFYYRYPVDGKPIQGMSVDGTRALIKHWGDCGIVVLLASETERDWLFQCSLIDRNINGGRTEQLLMPKAWIIHGNKDESVKRKDAFAGGMARCERNTCEHYFPFDIINDGLDAAMSGAADAIERKMKSQGGKSGLTKNLIADLQKMGVKLEHILNKFGVKDIAKLSQDDLIQIDYDVDCLKRGQFEIEDLYFHEQQKRVAGKADKLAQMAEALEGDKTPSRLKFEEHWKSQKPPARFAWFKKHTEDKAIVESFGKFTDEQQVASMAKLLDWTVERDVNGDEVKKPEGKKESATKEQYKVEKNPKGVDVKSAVEFIRRVFPGYRAAAIKILNEVGIGKQSKDADIDKIAAKVYPQIIALIPEDNQEK